MTAERPCPWSIGDVVAERYELLARLGEGLSGAVYRARDLHVGAAHEIVALKLIHGELLGDKQIAGRARREAHILRLLAGPNLCALLDVVEQEGLLLLAIEYVDGPSLDGYLDRKAALPLEECAALMAQIGAGLAAAHGRGVIHRDLKPSNVLIAGTAGSAGAEPSFLRELSAKVVDFGLAKILEGDGARTALTERGMIFGTPEYMAPEQVAGDPLDARADIYAAGVLLYRLLCGRLPFERDGAVATMKAHLTDPVPPLGLDSSLDPASARIERVVMKALAKAPEDRYRSAQELCEALAAAVAGGEPAVSARLQDTLIGSTTLRSHPDPALGRPRGGKVQVVVPSSEKTASEITASPSASPAPKDDPSGRPGRALAAIGVLERRFWAALAIAAALAAIAAGAWLGLR